MAKTGQNDSFYANNKRTLKFTVTDEDQVPVVAFNLTSCTVRWALSRVLPDGSYSATPVLKKDSALLGGVTITSAASGLVSVDIAESDTANLLGKYHQELEVVDAIGNKVVVAVGTITLLRNVSNA